MDEARALSSHKQPYFLPYFGNVGDIGKYKLDFMAQFPQIRSYCVKIETSELVEILFSLGIDLWGQSLAKAP